MSGLRQHTHDDLTAPIKEQGGIYEKVEIGEDTWIGNCAVIGANVGKKCIVAAGAVVVKPIPDLTVVGGNPAKVIRSREIPISNNMNGRKNEMSNYDIVIDNTKGLKK